MSVGYILSLFGAKAGLNCSVGSPERVIGLRYLNEAALELYKQSDPPGSLMEMVWKVNGDQTISLPQYVGTLRAIREYASQIPWHINRMRPRYSQFNWPDMWRNWRIKNKQALMVSITNETPLVITIPSDPIVPNFTVSIVGQTSIAAQIGETITINSKSVTTSNRFIDIPFIQKSAITPYDVTISDADGKVLSVIPNNQLSCQYQIVDISLAPWLSQNTSILDNYVEVLYKQTLPYLSNDTDEFPANDCDYILVNKMMQLYKEEQDKPDIALTYDNKATRSLARVVEDQNKETEDVVALVCNPHDTILRRIGSGTRRRFGWFGGRKY